MTCAFGSGLGQQLLDDHDAERSLLEIAAVFEDGWTIEAAARVADLKEDTALALSEALAQQSLIYAGSGPGSRSRMLDTIRAFVAEQLAARPTRTRSGAATSAISGRWPSRPTRRCADPDTAGGWST
jgi:hypothetical protein